MINKKKRNPLITEEDWLTVWFGLFILLIATILSILSILGHISVFKVPKLGIWHSNPLDVFYQSKKTKIILKESTSLKLLVDKINAKQVEATAKIIPINEGVQLRLRSSRIGAGKTISVKTQLVGGQRKLKLTKEIPDSDGIGAQVYVSQLLPSADILIGKGKLLLTAERMELIVFPMLFTLIGILILTSIGIRSMHQRVGRYALAFVFIFILAGISFFFSKFYISKAYGLSYAAWALAIGLLISNTIGTPKWLKPAVKTEMFIKTGLVLLGAEILFGQIINVGLPGLMVAWLVTPTVIIFMWFFGTRVLRIVSKPLVIIIAAATSVCGVSAAIAAAAASRAKKEELTLAVGMTLIFTVLMMIFMPMFIHGIGMGEVLGGAWMGGTIDSTGAVVAAGAFLGPKAETVAAVVKMIQNILIGAVGFCIALFWITSVERDPDAPRPGLSQIWDRFPKFIVGFVLSSILFSFVLTPIFGFAFDGNGLKLVEANIIKVVTNPLRGWFFCLAFVSIGLESNFMELGKKMEGGKPMALYVIGQSFNLLLTLAIAYLAFVILFPDAI
jgi:uncharacterized integral membrane protein (TIGR00698 family)